MEAIEIIRGALRITSLLSVMSKRNKIIGEIWQGTEARIVSGVSVSQSITGFENWGSLRMLWLSPIHVPWNRLFLIYLKSA
jgi:hypothetical protein